MSARFLKWWRKPPLRKRIIDALTDDYQTSLALIDKTKPWSYGAFHIEMSNLIDDGYAIARPRFDTPPYRYSRLEYRRGVRL